MEGELIGSEGEGEEREKKREKKRKKRKKMKREREKKRKIARVFGFSKPEYIYLFQIFETRFRFYAN